MLLGGNMAVENSKVGPIEEIAQSWQDEIEGRVKGLQTGSYAAGFQKCESEPIHHV